MKPILFSLVAFVSLAGTASAAQLSPAALKTDILRVANRHGGQFRASLGKVTNGQQSFGASRVVRPNSILGRLHLKGTINVKTGHITFPSF